MLNSYYHRLGHVELPPYQGRQLYMHSFDLEHPVMASGYEDYLDAALSLCFMAGIYEGRVHMTVDEKIIKAGMSQRRPGPHVDGCFVPEVGWGHGGGGWLHNCNNVPLPTIQRMPVIVAATVAGCRAWIGQFDDQPKADGDLSHLKLGEGDLLEPNVGYLLSPDCIHESMIFPRDTQRTFIRIALPVNSIKEN